jgi:hypothetical protein
LSHNFLLIVLPKYIEGSFELVRVVVEQFKHTFRLFYARDPLGFFKHQISFFFLLLFN